MRPESYKLFSQLLESHVNEASTTLDLITGNPGGQQVVLKLHKDMKLAHDQSYRPIEKISWSELKNTHQGAWVIIKGATGTGAIKAVGDRYEAVASSGDDPRTIKDSRGGNVIDFLKGEIGKLQKFYVGKNTSTVVDKQRKRAKDDKDSSNQVSNETLVKKFRPLWVKAISVAIADIKGHIANQIKNDAFEKAEKKLAQVRNLQNALDMIESGDTDIPTSVSKAINVAVLMAASHHYPEETGNITRAGYNQGFSAQFSEGPAKLLKDISSGDTKKVGTVLGFFKRSLISG